MWFSTRTGSFRIDGASPGGGLNDGRTVQTMTLSLFIHRNGMGVGLLPVVGWIPRFLFIFNINSGETMRQLSFHEKKKIRNRLLAIYRETGKVTERDLLRLSALTGVNYSIIAEIHKSIHYHPLQGVKEYMKGKIASNK
jgi:hypothetical protein